MTTSPRVDFDPSLFDDERPQPMLTTEKNLSSARRPNRWIPVTILVAVAVVATGATAVMRTGDVDLVDSLHRLSMSIPPGDDAVLDVRTPPSQARLVPMARPSAAHSAARPPWCSSDMLLCSTVITDRPAEALQRLTSTLTLEKRQQYRVKITVEPVEQP